MFDLRFNQDVIPFNHLRDGVFLVRRQAVTLPAKHHYGVLVNGKPLREFGFSGGGPLIIHRTQTIQADRPGPTDVWEIVDETPSPQIPLAATRAYEELNQPNYYVLTDNCEHTARYIVSGVRESTQVQSFVGAGLAIGFVLWLINRNEN